MSVVVPPPVRLELTSRRRTMRPYFNAGSMRLPIFAACAACLLLASCGQAENPSQAISVGTGKSASSPAVATKAPEINLAASSGTDTSVFFRVGKRLEAAGNFSGALIAYQKSADAGNHDAEFMIGRLYGNGKIPGGLKEAAPWHKKAAAGGVNDARNTLGYFYYSGWGVDKDDEAEALRLWSLAAASGSVDAYNYLGAYYAGFGDEDEAIDFAKSMEWFLRGADAGDATSKFSIAQILFKGKKGISANPAKAFSLCLSAAEAGNVSAQVRIGLAYKEGEGTTVDMASAQSWWERAAKAGDATAKLFLGEINTGADYARARLSE